MDLVASLLAGGIAKPLLGKDVLSDELAYVRAPPIRTLSVLAATGGVLTTVVVENCRRSLRRPYRPLLLTGGFGLFALISVYFTT